MLYHHDGCKAHDRITVREWLDFHFPRRKIGTGRPIPEPANSEALTPIDFMSGVVWKSSYSTSSLSQICNNSYNQ